jgi:hypothetical protein
MRILLHRHLYQSGMHGPRGDGNTNGGGKPNPNYQPPPPPRPALDAAKVGENTATGEHNPQFVIDSESLDGAYAAILSGDTSRYVRMITEIGSVLFEHDVNYADKVLAYFNDFEKGINSIKASMQGFSSDEGDYRLGAIEQKVFQKAKDLLANAGFLQEDVQGGDIVKKMMDAYATGKDTTKISKQDANKVLQYMANLEAKILPSDFKQEVLSAQLESSNKKRSGFFEATMPKLIGNLTDK